VELNLKERIESGTTLETNRDELCKKNLKERIERCMLIHGIQFQDIRISKRELKVVLN